MREASAAFPTRTSRAPDGLHLRQIRLICDDGLAMLCTLWVCIETSGAFPAQFARVAVPLIPKATEGGLRPIGALPSLDRVAPMM